MNAVLCPDCGKLIASRFSLHTCKPKPKPKPPALLNTDQLASGSLPQWSHAYTLYMADLPSFNSASGTAKLGRIRALRALQCRLRQMLPSSFNAVQIESIACDIADMTRLLVSARSQSGHEINDNAISDQ